MHILVIDDDNEIRNMYRAAFPALGHQVVLAANGTEALELIREHQQTGNQPFDAVLLDVEMPTMSGWRVLEAIRGMPDNRRLPVILYSGYGNLTSESYAKMLGGYALLHKPVPATTILDVMRRAVEERDTRQLRIERRKRNK